MYQARRRVLSKVAEKRFGSLPSWISLAMVDRWIFSCSIPLPIRPSLWWWSITWHEEEKQGGEKGPPFILRWWRSTSFFFKWLPSCDAAFKTYGPNFLPLNSLPGSSCYTECEAFSSRNQKSLWMVCWLSYEYFITYTQCAVQNL